MAEKNKQRKHGRYSLGIMGVTSTRVEPQAPTQPGTEQPNPSTESAAERGRRMAVKAAKGAEQLTLEDISRIDADSERLLQAYQSSGKDFSVFASLEGPVTMHELYTYASREEAKYRITGLAQKALLARNQLREGIFTDVIDELEASISYYSWLVKEYEFQKDNIKYGTTWGYALGGPELTTKRLQRAQAYQTFIEAHQTPQQ